jgi:hypothetical protein
MNELLEAIALLPPPEDSEKPSARNAMRLIRESRLRPPLSKRFVHDQLQDVLLKFFLGHGFSALLQPLRESQGYLFHWFVH